MQLTFLGGAGTVTGSKYLLEHHGKSMLVDCGLFQGLKQLRLRNWEGLPFDPRSLDAVVLTHAHIDHSGYLPAVVRSGFRGPVFATPATRALAGLLVPDAGHLQEEEAAFANRHTFSLIFKRDLESPKAIRTRRDSIVEMVVRFVRR